MSKSRRRYSAEFKIEAVRQVVEGGRSITRVARELGIDRAMLRRWKHQLEGASGVAFPGQGPGADADELERLRGEVARLREERDFLKKAAADSTGQCNTLYYFTDLEGVVHGTVRTSWSFCDPES